MLATLLQMTAQAAMDAVKRLLANERTLAQLQQIRVDRRAAMDKGLADAGLPPLNSLPETSRQLFKLNPDNVDDKFTPRLVRLTRSQSRIRIQRQ